MWILRSSYRKQRRELLQSWERDRVALASLKPAPSMVSSYVEPDIGTERPTVSQSEIEESERESVVVVATRRPPIRVAQREEEDIAKPHVYNGSVIFKPSESGLGNNVYGLVSAFVIAALTNRRLYCACVRFGVLRIDSGNYAFHNVFNFTDYWNSTIAPYRA